MNDSGAVRNAGGLPHGSEQLIQVNRLGQIIDRAVAHGGHGVAHVGESGDEQNGQRGVFLPRASRKVSRPVSPGIRTSEIIMSNFPARKVSSARSPESTTTVPNPWLRQKGIEQAALAGVVVHNQNARRLGGFFGARLPCAQAIRITA
jgi:hypothetical protein